jgi:hypothetical protein
MDDNCPLHSCSCHHGCWKPLSRLAKQGTFANFWQAHSSCHRAFCSISISPMFQCLRWGQVYVETPQISGELYFKKRTLVSLVECPAFK